MAKVKITGHASGTGVLTVTAPNTSSDRTITLPDSTGTILDENSSLPAANLTGSIAEARIPSTALNSSVMTKSTSEPATDTNPSGGVGTVWLRTTTGEMYCCTDATTDANVWTNIGDGTGGKQPAMVASGGAVDTYTVDGVDYKSHTFTAASTTFSVTSNAVAVSALIVAGGAGGAGDGGAGGGAGGLQTVTYTVSNSTDYTIVVGAGGGTCASNDCTTTAGGNSSAFGTTSTGGGTASRTGGGSGGSGGGAGRDGGSPGSGTGGQGYAGGDDSSSTYSGGGGGSGGLGGDASGSLSGVGGIGTQSDYRDGSDEWFAVGGTGGTNTTNAPSNTTGADTAGSGGHGSSDGVDNSTGTAGQDGIVIIRYIV